MKFKVGDKVIAHTHPSREYTVTKPGWAGVITKIVVDYEADLYFASAGWASSKDFELFKEDLFDRLYERLTRN